MILVLALIVISLFIIWANRKYSEGDEQCRISNAKCSAWITGTLSILAIIILVAKSYTTYLDTRTQYDAVINQYKGAVTMYADYATLDMGKATMTDLRYHGYQKNIATAIIDLRKEIVEYNKVLIKKRIMKKNPFFNWLVVAPDEDMKIINIVE